MKKVILIIAVVSTILSANNWEKIILEKDPFTGKEIIGFVNTSQQKGKLGENVKLIVRCGGKNYPEIMVNWNTFLHTEKVKMLERFIGHDKEREERISVITAELEKKYENIGTTLLNASGEYYGVSKDYESMFYPDLDTLKSNYSLSLKVMLYDIVSNKSLILRIAPYNDNPMTVKFDLSGLKELIEPYQEICKLPNKDDAINIYEKIQNNLITEMSKYN